MIGAGVGAGLGAALGVVGDTADEDNFFDTDGLLTAAGAILGAGTGAVTGFLIGRRGRKRMLVYESK